MKDFFEVLDQVYKKVLLGAALENDSQDYVLYLSPAFSDPDDSAATSSECTDPLRSQGGCQPPPASPSPAPAAPACLTSRARERVLLQLTVIRLMVTRALSLETKLHAKEKYREILIILLKPPDLASTLTCMFQSSDKLLSHMAAKCLAFLLYFQLKEKITLSNPWVAFCQKNLSGYSDELAYCLCALTTVIQEILKDTCSQKSEILKQLLTPFDPICEVFYTTLFSQHFENRQDTSKLVNSLISFLELLELLIASRIHLESHFTCQRILFLKPSYVLDVMTLPVPAFVRRKLIIFIKKCLLWKVGEDLCRGSVPALMPPNCHLAADVLALADAVLQAVDSGLLRTLSVHGAPFGFAGGQVQPGCGSPPGPDHVILSSASLLVIKSLEIKFQNCASAKHMKAALQSFMSELLAFLRPHLPPSEQPYNACEWLPRVFLEQDDDMLEAAKASMGIYLRLTRENEAAESWAPEKEVWSQHTHENGYNPHCMFLFFLKSIRFDSTVLLDFLISSETCFLEYFVKYLKLLHKEWDTFLTICEHFDVTESDGSITVCGCVSSLVQGRSSSQTESSPLASLDSPRHGRACVSWASEAFEPWNQAVWAQEIHATPPASQSLVDYDTSDDSEGDSANPCLANSQQASSDQEAVKDIQDTVGTSREKEELGLELRSGPLVPKEPAVPSSVDCDLAPNGTVSKAGISGLMVKCFGELQGSISRLQKKNLFPYNPAALLRLLKQIEVICNKSVKPL